MEVAESDRAQLPAATAPIDCFFFFPFQDGEGRLTKPMFIT